MKKFNIYSLVFSVLLGVVLGAGGVYWWLEKKRRLPVPADLKDAVAGLPISIHTPLSKAIALRDYSKVALGMSKNQVKWWSGLPDEVVKDDVSLDLEHWLYGPREPMVLETSGIKQVTVRTDMVVTLKDSRVADVSWGQPFSYTEFSK
ncbi:MAG: hypothetical protein HY400_03210 [Elusimicrobia bacterium]|nr:hypothetical protein [Elusimicrobiota bacterium]